MRSSADLRSSFRALLGEWAGDRDGPLPAGPDGLPPSVETIAREAIVALMHYQGISHTRLYVHRMRRYAGRRDLDEALVARIAELMAERMMYQDAVRLAQLALDANAAPQRSIFRFDELMEPLPALVAEPLLDVVGWLGLSGRPFARHYSAANAFGRARLRTEAGLRRWRALGRCYERERKWVERWLHMIDRALVKQPQAAAAVVETATMVRGYGDAYRQGLADWHLLIEGLVKPTLDGAIDVPDLAAAIEAARAAGGDPHQARMKAVIGALRDPEPRRVQSPARSAIDRLQSG